MSKRYGSIVVMRKEEVNETKRRIQNALNEYCKQSTQSRDYLEGISENDFLNSMSKMEHFVQGMSSVYDLTGENHFNDLYSSYRGSLEKYWGNSCLHFNAAVQKVLERLEHSDEEELTDNFFTCLNKK